MVEVDDPRFIDRIQQVVVPLPCRLSNIPAVRYDVLIVCVRDIAWYRWDYVELIGVAVFGVVPVAAIIVPVVWLAHTGTLQRDHYCTVQKTEAGRRCYP